MNNLFTPCPYRDHYKSAYRIIERHGAKPMDDNAAKAIKDGEYRRKMIANDEQVEALLDPVWQREIVVNGCDLGEESFRKAG